MNLRRSILKIFYPALRKVSYSTSHGRILKNETEKYPPVSFYDLEYFSNQGNKFSMASFLGKYVLIVNTASDCGYTGQYEELQRLYMQYQNRLIVIGFPSNDFKEQEKGTDAQISEFCKLNYGVTFPLAKKSVVIKTEGQNHIFKWLSNSVFNGWNNQAPVWNFSKYLISPEGLLLGYYGPAVSPGDVFPG